MMIGSRAIAFAFLVSCCTLGNLILGAPAASAQKSEDAIDQLLDSFAPPIDWREYLRKTQKPRVAPPADASDDDLIEYWTWESPEKTPDEATQRALLGVCERRPYECGSFSVFLAKDKATAERLKQLHDRIAAEHNERAHYLASGLHEWLAFNSDYFRDDLVNWACNSPDDISPEKQQRALARLLIVDREGAARGLREAATSGAPSAKVYALAALARNFDDVGGQSRFDWIDQLKGIPTDTTASQSDKSTAINALMAANWEGKEDWFQALFGDPGLLEREQYSNNGPPLNGVVRSEPDKWIPRLTVLLTNRNDKVRANAAECLASFNLEHARADALKPLLPWIADPKWIQTPNEHTRLRVLQSLTNVQIPEAVPFLLRAVEFDSGAWLQADAEALAHYKEFASAPALRKAAQREPDPHYRERVVRALFMLNAFTPKEIANGMKQYAVRVAAMPKEEWTDQAWDQFSRASHPLLLDIGHFACRWGNDDPDTAKVVVIEIRKLMEQNKKAAEILWLAMAQWRSSPSYEAIADRLKSGEFTSEWLWQLLNGKTNLGEYLKHAAGFHGAAAGIQGALTREPDQIRHVIDGDDVDAKRALFAAARINRVVLPVTDVGQSVIASDQRVAKAAVRYLEGMDTSEARAELKERQLDAVRVLGTQLNFSAFSMDQGEISQSEVNLRNTFSEPEKPNEIFALLSEGNFGSDGQRAVLVYDNRIIVRRVDGNGRTRERELPAREFNILRTWMVKNNVFELPPYDEGVMDGIQLQFVHLTPNGGERVFMNNPPGGPAGAASFHPGIEEPRPDPIVYAELTRRMMQLNEGPMRIVYRSLEKLPGFRVVHSKEDGEVARTANSKGGLRAAVFISHDRPLEWHGVNAGGLSKDFELEPPDPLRREFHPEFLDLQDRGLDVLQGPYAGKRIWPGQREKDKLDGLWVSGPNGSPELLAKGIFSAPVISPNGAWMVVAKTFGTNMWAVPNGVVRIHLPSKRMFQVDLPPADNFDPIVWVDAHKKLLLYQQRDERDWKAGPEQAEFHLLDAQTGAHNKVDGEFRPFFDAAKKDLQPTGRRNEFWAAVHSDHFDPKLEKTVLGRFDSKNFCFKSVLEFPSVRFESGNSFVDEPAHLVWVNVNGDILVVSLPTGADL